MSVTILFVDDEPDALSGYRRVLRGQFAVDTAVGPHEGLAMIQKRPYGVVVADMCMPGMDGIQFLSRVRELAPESIRIMLTGHADTSTAIDAVNRGSIFRFLTKPCAPDVLAASLVAGLEQWRLVRAEKELLEQTLKGSIRVLIDVLELLNPVAFGRATRARRIVGQLGAALEVKNLWQIELAALLSQLGCITVPPEVLERHFSGEPLNSEETKMIAEHPQVGGELIANIPRLEPIARIIQLQARFGTDEKTVADAGGEISGAALLHAALEFDGLLVTGVAPAHAVRRLREGGTRIAPKILAALERYEGHDAPASAVKSISVRQLTVDMEAEEDIRAKNGTLLVPRGRRVTYPLLVRIRNFAAGVGVQEPFLVRGA
jgi:response regulator RpfG family c-di-GMP phosphodiesterase